MKNRFKKMALSFVALSSLVSTSLVADDIDLWKKSTLNQIVQRGEFQVCTEPGYMPFEMTDKKGEIIGFDVDMAKKMAKEMGVNLKLIPTAWDGIIAALVTGKCDIIMSGMTITQQRNLQVNFADPYIVIGQTVLIKKDLPVKSVKELDDPKYTIVTKLGVTGEIAARKFFKKAKIVTFETESDGVAEVLNGKGDAFVYDKPYNDLFMSDKGKDKLVHLDKPLTYEPIGWAIRKGDPDFLNWLNNFLRQAKEDKVVEFYDKLDEKWFKDSSWLKRVQ